MGTMEFRSGNHEKARDLLTEFIRIRRDNSTKNDGDYVNVLFMIGNIHKMQGHEDEAQLCWSEAYQVFQELGLAETNPQIAKVMNHLLKVEEEKEEAENKKKKKNKGGNVFGKMTEKFKGNAKEESGKKRRKGKESNFNASQLTALGSWQLSSSIIATGRRSSIGFWWQVERWLFQALLLGWVGIIPRTIQ
jgi:tetratricopeptide (TPR) repeat protein